MSLPETYKILYSSKTHGGTAELRTVPLQKPGKNQVLVKIEFAPINPTDLMSMEHRFYSPDSVEQLPFGSEASGTVVAVGDSLEHEFKVGDRVHVSYQTWAQYKLADSNDIFPIQEGLSLEEAASHFVNPATVYYMGVVAQRGGHKAAVHTAGSSALGKMLIRYFKHLGIKLINVVRRDEYIEELKSEGADYVLNSQKPDFSEQLKEIAEKEGANLVFEAVAGNFTNTVVKAMPNGTTCWVYGLLSSTSVNIDVLELCKGKSLKGLYLPAYVDEVTKKNEYRKFMTEVHSLLKGLLGSKVQKVFDFDDLDNALAFYKENSSKGKVLLKFN